MFSPLETQNLLDLHPHLDHASTNIDLLQIARKSLEDQDSVSWETGLTDSSILQHLTVCFSSPRYPPKVIHQLTQESSSG